MTEMMLDFCKNCRYRETCCCDNCIVTYGKACCFECYLVDNIVHCMKDKIAYDSDLGTKHKVDFHTTKTLTSKVKKHIMMRKLDNGVQ